MPFQLRIRSVGDDNSPPYADFQAYTEGDNALYVSASNIDTPFATTSV